MVASALVVGTTAASAQVTQGERASLQWALSASLGQRELGEWSDGGERLVTERGPLARLAVSVVPAGAPIELRASLARGWLDYGGRTQAGVPLATRSRHTEGELALRWHPWTTAWGEPVLALAWLGNRRSIEGTSASGALVEKSQLLLPGVGWQTPALAWPNTSLRLQGEALWRVSVHHELDVDFGGVFDEAAIDGGRRREALLRLHALTPSQWRWTLEWRHARQAASPEAPLSRRGAPAGTVHQPRLRIDDVTLSLTRSF